MANLIIKHFGRTTTYTCEGCGEDLYRLDSFDSNDAEDSSFTHTGFNKNNSKKCPNCNILWENKVESTYDRNGHFEGEKTTVLNQDGWCYIATATYGSIDHPSVIVLRNYRDITLKKYFLGRVFINIYYEISPKLIKYFSNESVVRKISKLILDFLIKNMPQKYK